ARGALWLTQLLDEKIEGVLAVALNMPVEEKVNAEAALGYMGRAGKVGVVVVPREIGRLHVPGMETLAVREVGRYKPIHYYQGVSIANGRMVPVIELNADAKDYEDNDELFGVYSDGHEPIEGLDSFHQRLFDKIARLAVGGYLAGKGKNKKDLRKHWKTVKAELLAKLFKQYPDFQDAGRAIVFRKGKIVVRTNLLFKFVREHLAEAELSKSA
ncbi:MAG: hypothetical protein PHS88_05235, partial [Candidatus Omnitrophica bacterium]|nr:hypothetical protein [Candidatus Omnitrophota bacterium]